MSVKQVSVFLENRQGALADFCTLLGEANIDLMALSIADTTDFGILRAIVPNAAALLSLAKDKGYTAKENNVLAVTVPDEAGGLAGAVRILNNGGFFVEYLYSFVRRVGEKAVIIFKVNDTENAEKLLLENGIGILSQNDL